jgi:hypothetical protein
MKPVPDDDPPSQVGDDLPDARVNELAVLIERLAQETIGLDNSNAWHALSFRLLVERVERPAIPTVRRLTWARRLELLRARK